MFLNRKIQLWLKTWCEVLLSTFLQKATWKSRVIALILMQKYCFNPFQNEYYRNDNTSHLGTLLDSLCNCPKKGHRNKCGSIRTT